MNTQATTTPYQSIAPLAAQADRLMGTVEIEGDVWELRITAAGERSLKEAGGNAADVERDYVAAMLLVGEWMVRQDRRLSAH